MNTLLIRNGLGFFDLKCQNALLFKKSTGVPDEYVKMVMLCDLGSILILDELESPQDFIMSFPPYKKDPHYTTFETDLAPYECGHAIAYMISLMAMPHMYTILKIEGGFDEKPFGWYDNATLKSSLRAEYTQDIDDGVTKKDASNTYYEKMEPIEVAKLESFRNNGREVHMLIKETMSKYMKGNNFAKAEEKEAADQVLRFIHNTFKMSYTEISELNPRSEEKPDYFITEQLNNLINSHYTPLVKKFKKQK